MVHELVLPKWDQLLSADCRTGAPAVCWCSRPRAFSNITTIRRFQQAHAAGFSGSELAHWVCQHDGGYAVCERLDSSLDSHGLHLGVIQCISVGMANKNCDYL